MPNPPKGFLTRQFYFSLISYPTYIIINPMDKKKILLVEDDPFFHTAFRKLFAIHLPEVELHGVKSLSEAMNVISGETFHLAICDYYLPDSEKGEAVKFLVKKKYPQ